MLLGIILNVNVDFAQVKSVGHYHHRKQGRSKEQAGQGTKISLENQKYGANKLIFPQMKNVSENYPQFGLAPSKMFASLAIYIFVFVCVCVCVCVLPSFGAEHLCSVCYPNM
jgi:hypothetical protein